MPSRTVEVLCHRGPADGTAKDANQGDADLNGREEIVRRLGQLQGQASRPTPLIDQLLQPYFSSCDDGDLRAGEDPVAENQQQDEENLKRQAASITTT